VLEAARHPGADKLLVLKADEGEEAPRAIVAGIADRFAPEELVGRGIAVVVNLKPVKLRGVWSNGMLLAAGGEAGPAGEAGAAQALLEADVEAGMVIR